MNVESGGPPADVRGSMSLALPPSPTSPDLPASPRSLPSPSSTSSRPTSHWAKLRNYNTMAVQGSLARLRLKAHRKAREEFASGDSNSAYWEQGDKAFHTKEQWELRMRMRKSPLIVDELMPFWTLVTRASTQASIDFEEFWAVYVRIFRELITKTSKHPFVWKEVREACKEDWEADCEGEDSLSCRAYCDSIFEMADMWVESSDVQDYVAFLHRLHAEIEQPPLPAQFTGSPPNEALRPTPRGRPKRLSTPKQKGKAKSPSSPSSSATSPTPDQSTGTKSPPTPSTPRESTPSLPNTTGGGGLLHGGTEQSPASSPHSPPSTPSMQASPGAGASSAGTRLSPFAEEGSSEEPPSGMGAAGGDQEPPPSPAERKPPARMAPARKLLLRPRSRALCMVSRQHFQTPRRYVTTTTPREQQSGEWSIPEGSLRQSGECSIPEGSLRGTNEHSSEGPSRQMGATATGTCIDWMDKDSAEGGQGAVTWGWAAAAPDTPKSSDARASTSTAEIEAGSVAPPIGPTESRAGERLGVRLCSPRSYPLGGYDVGTRFSPAPAVESWLGPLHLHDKPHWLGGSPRGQFCAAFRSSYAPRVHGRPTPHATSTKVAATVAEASALVFGHRPRMHATSRPGTAAW